MRLHFIAIGGAAMHNIAIAVHLKGNTVTGSDDEIFEPSRSRLNSHGLLPFRPGWYPEKITSDIDAVILGMHALKDNPELIRAQELGIKIYSFPEYLYEQTKNKKRIVIGGSHGKTTITSMIMHVFKKCSKHFDYMVGSQIEGFDTMAGLDEQADTAVFEGDEYLSSSIDLRPKFHLYLPHIAVISGIAWDHINVFPTFDIYYRQFEIFAQKIQPGGSLIYFEKDDHILKIVEKLNNRTKKIPYNTHKFSVKNGETYLSTPQGDIKVPFFGTHNMQNVSAALMVCRESGISDNDFYNAITTFKGAKKRLQLLVQNEHRAIFSDFAHSPSKLKATIEAVKNQFPDRVLIACMELHTFSSLNKDFLKEYEGSMTKADIKVIFYNPDTILHKQMEMIDPAYIKMVFGHPDLIVINDRKKLTETLQRFDMPDFTLLMMSSGNFAGLDYQKLTDTLI